MGLEEKERIIARWMANHEIDIEIAKIVTLLLMNNIDGQEEFIKYISNSEELTEEELLSKAREIRRIKENGEIL